MRVIDAVIRASGVEDMTQDEERLVSDALKTYQLNHPARDVWPFAIKFGVWLERNYRKE